jgi:Ger(x)C family germination protein
MRKFAVLILIICITSVMLTSCYDSNEVDDLLHVIIIGVDRGVTDRWRLTVQFPTLKESTGGSTSSGGQGSGKASYATLTVDAPSFFTGVDILNTALPRRLNFMHTTVLVISEEMAKSGMLGEFLAPIIRFRQIRRSMHVYVSKTSAMDFVKESEPIVGTALSKNIQIMFKESSFTGFYPHVTLNDFYDEMKSTYRQPTVTLAALSSGKSFKQEGEKFQGEFKTGGEYYAGGLPLKRENKMEFFGVAVFDGDKMVGQLSGEETRLMQMADGEFKMGFFTMQDPLEPSLIVPFDVRKSGDPAVKIQLDGNKPVIHLKVELEGDLLAVQSRVNYEQPDLKQILERAFERQIKDGLDKLMEKSKNLKTDIFGFGQIAARQFPTIQEWEKYNWLEQFQNAQITTEVKFTIRRTGTQLKSSPIISTEGKK